MTAQSLRAFWKAAALVPPVLVIGLIVVAVTSLREISGGQVGFGTGIMLYAVAGRVILTRRPENVVGRLMIVVGLAGALAATSGAYAEARPVLPNREWVAWFASWVWPISLASLVAMLQLFPDGFALSRRWRAGLWLTAASGVTLCVGLMFTPGSLADYPAISNPVGIEALRNTPLYEGGGGWAMMPVALFVAAASVVVRYKRSSGERRQQLKWLALAGALLAVGWALIVPDVESLKLLSSVVLPVALIALPVSIAVAMLKYRLYDIDVVINKTIVFGVLAVFITGIYVAVVVGIGTALGSSDEPNLVLSITATAIVAIAFSPVKERTQRLANRLVYGHRLSPYDVLSDLSRAAAAAPEPRDVLNAVAQAAALGVDAEQSEVVLHLHDGSEIVARHPDVAAEDGAEVRERVPVVHRGDRLGEIAVVKGRGDTPTSRDRTLLESLAGQAGPALHNARLVVELRARLDQISGQAEELQMSRSRIVTAADDSRRRLERDISRGPRTGLEAVRRKLEAVEELLKTSPDDAAAVLEETNSNANETLDALRELARGIYPPLLADKGIAAALEAHGRKQDLDVTIVCEDGVREARFPEGVETTVYFCCVEALPGNPSATIVLDAPKGYLTTSIRGVEPGPEQVASLRDRVEAIGGDFALRDGRVDFSLPVRHSEDADQFEAAAHASSSSSGPN